MPVFIITFRGYIVALMLIGGIMGAPRTTVCVVVLLIAIRIGLWIRRLNERAENRRFRRHLY